MSAILSADDLNDFISPGVACIKPIETLPVKSEDSSNPYEVTTEERAAAAEPPPPAQISLTDCLACSGCVTSAEAVLVTLQSHTEVLTTLDTYRSLRAPWAAQNGNGVHSNGINGHFHVEEKIFVASVSPQARASLAAVFNVTEAEAGNMITHLLSGPSGLRNGGHQGSDFTWVIDTNVVRDACLLAAADEVNTALSSSTSRPPGSEDSIDAIPKGPILTSACPGWICYAEKTHPYVLPHLSRLKSPQALTGTLIKSVLSQRYAIPPSQIWHLAIMPCFDKKLEASRSELTSSSWLPSSPDSVRDVDCVITARELLSLASTRSISFATLPRTPLPAHSSPPFPDPKLNTFLFPPLHRRPQTPSAGPSGGYLQHILATQRAAHPGSSISVNRGRNADVLEYSLVRDEQTLFRAARFYGFRNIQNLVRRLKPAKASRLPGGRAGGVSRRPGGVGVGVGSGVGEGAKEYGYVEVMACPGGCTNGGGQVKVGEVGEVRGAHGVGGEEVEQRGGGEGPQAQKEWLARVDEAYFSASESEPESEPESDQDVPDTNGDINMTDAPSRPDDLINNISPSHIHDILSHWSSITGIPQKTLLYTSYRKVESDVGKKKQSDVERVAGLAVAVGGGW